MMPAGSINAWKCPDCGQLTSAVHVDEGVTPMMLACRATEGCQGMAVSAGTASLLIAAIAYLTPKQDDSDPWHGREGEE